jgi:ElaB/YqjD/DUF883 family membrane-anchored ribosome-binding protein
MSMSSEELEGKGRDGVNRAEETAKAGIDSAEGVVKGETHQFAERTEAAARAARDAVSKAADQARAAVTSVGGRAADTYAELRARAQDVSNTVDPFVRESPYLAVSLAALGGVVLGALLFGGGSKVIYLKAARD